MDRDTLADLEHENLIAGIAFVGSHIEDAIVRRSEGVVLIGSGLPIRLFNQVLIEADDAPPSAVAAAVETLRGRRCPFVLNLRIGRDDALIPLARELGMNPVSASAWMPGMALHPVLGEPPGAPEGHEIRLVTTRPGFDDHIAVGAAGFEMPESLLRMAMQGALEAGDDVAVYVGYTGDQPVTSGLGLRTGRTIGVYNIATVPSARRRGYGAAMTERIVADAAAQGCDVAVLQASEMGLPIYERLGYRTVVEYMGYTDPAT